MEEIEGGLRTGGRAETMGDKVMGAGKEEMLEAEVKDVLLMFFRLALMFVQILVLSCLILARLAVLEGAKNFTMGAQ